MDKKGIFLDDEREIEDVTWLQLPEGVNWTIVRTFDEMASIINNNEWTEYDYISFDHDLNQMEHETGCDPTGYTLIKMLCDRALDINKHVPRCFFHTQNVVGRKNMESYYFNYLNFVFHINEGA